MFVDETQINGERRAVYVERIRESLRRIGVIDGCDAVMLANELVKSFEFALQHHLAEWSRVELRTQLGLGTREWLRVRGRVAERSRVRMPGPDDDAFDILVSCWYRFLISGQQATPVQARRGASEVVTSTDEEGFFDLVISAQPELGDRENYWIDLELGSQATMRAEKESGRVLVPLDDASVGLLVDLDGIVLAHPTHRFARVLGEIVLGQSHRLRPPLTGAVDFMQRMARGYSASNPIFYLSNAPRHLCNHLECARIYSGLPEGYLHLRDYDLRLRRLTTTHINVLEMLLAHDLVDQYPDLPFIFIGTRERWKFYEPLLKALCHRLDAIYLIGDEEMPEALNELNSELNLNFVVGGDDRLVMHAVQRGWANA